MTKQQTAPINDLSEVPAFASEAEEREFWSTHSFGELLLEQMRPAPFEADE